MASGILMLVLSSVLVGLSHEANILFLSPHTSHSHTHFFFYTIKELASRGHTITHWNGLKPRELMNNVTQLYSSNLNYFNTHHPVGLEDNRRLEMLLSLPDRITNVCNACYRDPTFQILVNSSEKFDLIVIEAFMNECVLPMVTQFDAPFIYLSGLPPSSWVLDATCSPLSPAANPALGTTFTEDMNLFERIINSLTLVASIYYRHWVIMPLVDSMAAKMWTQTDIPPIREIEKNVSMYITNTHFSLFHQYPKMSNIVEAAGLHLVPPEPLPQDILDFVEGSGDAGFIVLSFGSIVRGSTMPEKTRRIFVSAFSRLPQRVLWKWEDSTGIPDLPPNVRLETWLPPLLDLMAHPKMRLVMTHGGLFSNQEAVWSGVPLIGFPVFGDQPQYAARAQRDGYALHLDWQTLTEDLLYNSIKEIVNNPKYKERAREVSALMRDQTDQPLDRAVNAIEYVIRHRGAPHLRPAACRLPLLQREGVDVGIVLFFTFLLLAFVTYRLASLLVCQVFKWIIKGDENNKLKID